MTKNTLLTFTFFLAMLGSIESSLAQSYYTRKALRMVSLYANELRPNRSLEKAPLDAANLTKAKQYIQRFQKTWQKIQQHLAKIQARDNNHRNVIKLRARLTALETNYKRILAAIKSSPQQNKRVNQPSPRTNHHKRRGATPNRANPPPPVAHNHAGNSSVFTRMESKLVAKFKSEASFLRFVPGYTKRSYKSHRRFKQAERFLLYSQATIRRCMGILKQIPRAKLKHPQLTKSGKRLKAFVKQHSIILKLYKRSSQLSKKRHRRWKQKQAMLRIQRAKRVAHNKAVRKAKYEALVKETGAKSATVRRVIRQFKRRNGFTHFDHVSAIIYNAMHDKLGIETLKTLINSKANTWPFPCKHRYPRGARDIRRNRKALKIGFCTSGWSYKRNSRTGILTYRYRRAALLRTMDKDYAFLAGKHRCILRMVTLKEIHIGGGRWAFKKVSFTSSGRFQSCR